MIAHSISVLLLLTDILFFAALVSTTRLMISLTEIQSLNPTQRSGLLTATVGN